MVWGVGACAAGVELGKGNVIWSGVELEACARPEWSTDLVGGLVGVPNRAAQHLLVDERSVRRLDDDVHVHDTDDGTMAGASMETCQFVVPRSLGGRLGRY